MKRFGLPTYPIFDGMLLGNRDEEEITWLLEHGVIQSDLCRYFKIKKVEDVYHVLMMSDSRKEDEEIVVESETHWSSLNTVKKHDLGYWYWYSLSRKRIAF